MNVRLSFPTGCCCQVSAEEASIGRGGIVVGDALMQLPRHCRVSPPAPTHANTPTTNTTTITQPGACTAALSSAAARGCWRVHAHQATEEQQKHLVWLYLSPQSHVVFFISIHLTRMQHLNLWHLYLYRIIHNNMLLYETVMFKKIKQKRGFYYHFLTS